jgi:DUF1365 family protein
MSAALYEGHVAHARLVGRRGAFRHPVYCWLVDVGDLPRLPWPLRPFASLRSRDHIGDPARGLRENLDAFLAERGVQLDGGRVLLLTNARVLGHVFNPLSVWWCHGPAGELRCVVAEVHNTYGERHGYLLQPDGDGRSEADKAFYVSPFLEVEGRYRMRLPEPDDRLALSIELRQDGGRAFSASLVGHRVVLSPRSLARLLLRYQWMTLRVSALIRLHGVGLLLRGQRRVRRPLREA